MQANTADTYTYHLVFSCLKNVDITDVTILILIDIQDAVPKDNVKGAVYNARFVMLCSTTHVDTARTLSRATLTSVFKHQTNNPATSV